MPRYKVVVEGRFERVYEIEAGNKLEAVNATKYADPIEEEEFQLCANAFVLEPLGE